MTINITLGDRIAFAERLPQNGNLKMMADVKRIKNILVGFADAQQANWRLVQHNGSWVCGLPNTNTSITLPDNLVLSYADIIEERSKMEFISQDEAQVFEAITKEAERLRSQAESQNE